jgi:hypothetical protein
MRRGLAGLVLLAAALAAPAVAEHQIHYRYTVLGYVRDGAGRPRTGETVELIRDKTGFSYLGRTDETGLFVIVARLGDESEGESLTLRLGTTRLSLVARFDATNHTDERGTRVDVDGTRVAERRASFRATLATLLGAPRP